MNNNWYNLNSGRRYPVDDNATWTTDDGILSPFDVIVDCHLRIPSSVGKVVYISGMTVTSGLTTLTFLAAAGPTHPADAGVESSDSSNGFTPIGAITVPQPIDLNRHYPISAMLPGVGGWVVFGPGVNRPFRGHFSSPLQSMLTPKTARAYQRPPVTSIGKYGRASALTGVVGILTGNDLELAVETMTIEDRAVSAIVIRLIDDFDRNVFSLYAGPCSGRPESDTCEKPGLIGINGAVPDCDGNIDIVFTGACVTAQEFLGGSAGLALGICLGMLDVCTGQDRLPDNTGRLPNEYADLCDSSSISTSMSVSGGGPGPGPGPGSSADSISSGICLDTFPQFIDFNDRVARGFSVAKGTFDIAFDDSADEPSSAAPGVCSSAWSFESLSYGSSGFSESASYSAHSESCFARSSESSADVLSSSAGSVSSLSCFSGSSVDRTSSSLSSFGSYMATSPGDIPDMKAWFYSEPEGFVNISTSATWTPDPLAASFSFQSINSTSLPSLNPAATGDMAAVEFDGSTSVLRTVSQIPMSNYTSAGGYTMFAVFKSFGNYPGSGNDLAPPLCLTEDGYFGMTVDGIASMSGPVPTLFGCHYDTANKFVSVPIPRNHFVIATQRYDGSTLSLRAVAAGFLVQESQLTGVGSLSMSSQRIWMGGSPLVGVNHFDGDIGEIIIFNRALTPLEHARIEAYLAAKWLQTEESSGTSLSSGAYVPSNAGYLDVSYIGYHYQETVRRFARCGGVIAPHDIYNPTGVKYQKGYFYDVCRTKGYVDYVNFIAMQPFYRTVSGLHTEDVACTYAYEASSPSRTNIAVWDNCAYDHAVGKYVMTDLKIVPSGSQLNGGVVVNWRMNSSSQPVFHYVEIDANTGALQIRRFTGTTFTVPLIDTGPIGIVPDRWYRLLILVEDLGGGAYRLTAKIYNTSPISLLTTLSLTMHSEFEPTDGRFGLGSRNSRCRFSYFKIGEL